MRVELLTSPWCSMCRVMKAKLEGRVEVVDVFDRPDRLQGIDHQTVPLLVFWRGSEKVAEHPGFMPLSRFEELVREYGGEA